MWQYACTRGTAWSYSCSTTSACTCHLFPSVTERREILLCMYFYCILCKLSPNQLNYILKLCECIYRGDLPTRKESTSNPVAIFLELFYYFDCLARTCFPSLLLRNLKYWNLPDSSSMLGSIPKDFDIAWTSTPWMNN